MDACTALARVNLTKGNLEAAQEYTTQALRTAKRLESQEYLITVYQLLYKYYERTGDKALALSYYKQADELEDILINTKELNEIENMRINLLQQHSRAALETERQRTETAQEAKNTAYVSLAVFLFLSAVSIALLYLLLRARTKTSRLQREMLRVRETFFANITHEFRTPIMVINGLSKKLAEGALKSNTEIKSYGETIHRQGNNLLELVNQLLDITRVKSAIGGEEWRQANIVDFLRMLTDNYRQYARERGVQLNFRSHETELNVNIVPDYLKKIVRNLISNALKNTPEGGHITLTLKQQGEHFVITVSDDGRGISAEALPHIFEPFYQGSKESRNISSGIGLVLVHQIVENLHGSIKAESNEGEGATFTVLLPVSSGRKLPRLEIEKSNEGNTFLPNVTENGAAPTDDEETAEKDTVLLVEDNHDSATYIASLLSKNYRVVHASDGEEALEKLNSILPNLIITDLMMPHMDGYDFCRAVRSSEVLCHIPIIILTARVTDKDRLEGLDAGADAYIIKPFDSEELLLQTHKLLETRKLLRLKFSNTDIQQATDSITPDADGRAFIGKVNDNIYAMMAQKQVDSETLAKRMRISRSHLNRRLLALTGLNTSSYITEVRISYAKRLFDSDLEISVSNVAARCGYDELSYFSRVFKQITGIPPTQYRRQIK